MTLDNFVRTFRVMERALSDSALQLHLSNDFSTAVSTMRGLMVVGLFAWLDTQKNITQQDYAVLMDPTHPQREPFTWISWELFRGLKRIRNTFAHSLEGIIEDDDLNFFQNLQQKIKNNEIEIEYKHDTIIRNDKVQEFFKIIEVEGSVPKKFRFVPDVSIIHLAARIIYQYLEKS